MSGYLQRLVGSVAHPATSVHPRTGSIYTPQRVRPESPLQDSDEVEILASSASESMRDTRPVQWKEVFEHGLPVPIPLLPKQAPEGVQPTRPAPGRSQFGDSRESSPRQDLGPEPSRDDRVADLPTRKARANSERGPDDPIEQPYRPLILSSRMPETKATVPAARVEQGHTRRVAPTEPDEIQVHIGRIEITAVPAPVQPQVAKAPDKSISLDAYLNRRNGQIR